MMRVLFHLVVAVLICGCSADTENATLGVDNGPMEVQSVLQPFNITDRQGWSSGKLWRDDYKCGNDMVWNWLDDGFTRIPAQCNPKDNPCCSSSGWCGSGHEYCSCPTCVDYSKVPACRDGYEATTGDVIGSATRGSYWNTDTSEKCANYCDENDMWQTKPCCSYMWSPSERKCDLYTECKPNGPQWKDYQFCKNKNPGAINVCQNIKVVTKGYAKENSWTFGSCSPSRSYSISNTIYYESCCQPAGSYDFVCKDSYGDGWHGGYVQIGESDKKLCEDFTSGKEQTIDDLRFDEWAVYCINCSPEYGNSG